METTGLDARRDLLLEVAVVITGADLEEVAWCRRLVAQPAGEVAERLAATPEAAGLPARSGLLAELASLYRLRDGLHVNAALVADGYAQVATYPPNVAHAPELLELQRVAPRGGSRPVERLRP